MNMGTFVSGKGKGVPVLNEAPRHEKMCLTKHHHMKTHWVSAGIAL